MVIGEALMAQQLLSTSLSLSLDSLIIVLLSSTFGSTIYESISLWYYYMESDVLELISD